MAQLGVLAAGLGFRRTLLVADPGLVRAGHVDRALHILRDAGVETVPFHDFDHDPDSHQVDAGARVARAEAVDSLVALGGGSSLDCAKGVSFIATNGGTMADYRGHGKAQRPLLPMIGVPTTAGTGSEAQSYALISDPVTHAKMACGDKGAAFRIAVLDPELTLSLPPAVTAVAGYDALAHAVEAFVTTRRNPASDLYAREAWRLLEKSYERVLSHPGDVTARGAMMLGAHWAGAAIEASMLGATHACANPLSARYGTAHGVAIALLLPTVVRWNAGAVGERYAELLAVAGRAADERSEGGGAAERLARRLEDLAGSGGLVRGLRDSGIAEVDLPALAEDAAQQWTGRFNPRPFDAAGALELYRAAF